MRKYAIGCALKGICMFLACLLVLGACLFLSFAPKFAMGKSYTLYLGNSSSARQITTQNPVKDKFLYPVRGESTVYEGDLSAQLIQKFSATVLFSEEACGIRNYYAYSPVLGECVVVNGCAVNLHIAVMAEGTAVGSPFIFGGY